MGILENSGNKADNVLRVNCSDLEDIGIITHYKGKPFTGIAEEYTNNLLNNEFILKDGLKEGINQYHPNGKLHAEVICENDEPIKIVRGFKFDGTAMNDEEILKHFQVMFPFKAILNNVVKEVVKKQLKSGKLMDDLKYPYLSDEQIKALPLLIVLLNANGINNFRELKDAVSTGYDWLKLVEFFTEQEELDVQDLSHISNKELGLNDDATQDDRDNVFQNNFTDSGGESTMLKNLIWEWLEKDKWEDDDNSSGKLIDDLTKQKIVSNNSNKDNNKPREIVISHNKNDPKADFPKAIKNGSNKLQSSDYEGAISEFNKAIKIQPRYADSYNLRGLCKTELKDTKGAMSDFNKAIKLRLDFASAYMNRGDLKASMNDFKGALEDYYEVIRIDPTNTLIYDRSGMSKQLLQDFEGSIRDFSKGIELDPKNSDLFFSRGVSKVKINDKKGAYNDFKSAKSLGNTNAINYLKIIEKSGFSEPNSQSSDSNTFNQDNNKPGRKVNLSGKWGSRFNNWNESQREILGELASNSQSYDSDTINKKSIKKIKISDLNDDQKHWLGLVDMRVNSIPFNSIKDIYTAEALGNEHFIEYKKNETEIPETERQEVALSRVKGLLSISDYILRNGSDAQKYHYKSSIKGAILYANYNGINIDEFKKTPSKYIEEKIPSKKKRRFKKKEVVKKSIPSNFEILKVKYIFYIPVTYLLWVIVLSIINPAYPSSNTFLELIIIYNNGLEFISLIVTSFVSGFLIYIFSNKISENIPPFRFLYIVFMVWLILTTFALIANTPFISDYLFV